MLGFYKLEFETKLFFDFFIIDGLSYDKKLFMFYLELYLS